MRNEQDGFDMHIEPINPQIYEGSAEDGTLIIHQTLEQLIQRYLRITTGVINVLVPTRPQENL